jgi:head-tail adaptor
VTSSPQGEAAAHDALVGRISHRLRIRWRADVSPGWRAMLGARTLRIEAAVDRDQKRRWLHLDCTEEIR